MVLIGNASPLGDGYQQTYRFVCGALWSEMTGWCDERFSELVLAASTSTDRVERPKQLGEAYHILTEGRPILPLFQLENIVGMSSAIDWTPDANESLWMYRAHPKGN